MKYFHSEISRSDRAIISGVRSYLKKCGIEYEASDVGHGITLFSVYTNEETADVIDLIVNGLWDFQKVYSKSETVEFEFVDCDGDALFVTVNRINGEKRRCYIHVLDI